MKFERKSGDIAAAIAVCEAGIIRERDQIIKECREWTGHDIFVVRYYGFFCAIRDCDSVDHF